MDEKLYMVCVGCGEVFYDLDIAKGHENECDEQDGGTFTIKFESEAM